MSLHRYLYCQNDPVNGVDPSGHGKGVGPGNIPAQIPGLTEAKMSAKYETILVASVAQLVRAWDS